MTNGSKIKIQKTKDFWLSVNYNIDNNQIYDLKI